MQRYGRICEFFHWRELCLSPNPNSEVKGIVTWFSECGETKSIFHGAPTDKLVWSEYHFLPQSCLTFSAANQCLPILRIPLLLNNPSVEVASPHTLPILPVLQPIITRSWIDWNMPVWLLESCVATGFEALDIVYNHQMHLCMSLV